MSLPRGLGVPPPSRRLPHLSPSTQGLFQPSAGGLNGGHITAAHTNAGCSIHDIKKSPSVLGAVA
jgi:hypothetical protein